MIKALYINSSYGVPDVLSHANNYAGSFWLYAVL